MCMCRRVYVYVYMCICVYVYMCMCMCMCICVGVCMCICVGVYVYMCRRVCVYSLTSLSYKYVLVCFPDVLLGKMNSTCGVEKITTGNKAERTSTPHIKLEKLSVKKDTSTNKNIINNSPVKPTGQKSFTGIEPCVTSITKMAENTNQLITNNAIIKEQALSDGDSTDASLEPGNKSSMFSDKGDTTKQGTSDAKGQYRCHQCDEVFNKQNIFAKHTISHTVDTICDKYFTDLKDSKLKCDSCNKPFSTNIHLKEHMGRGHEGEKLFSFVYI